MPENSHRTPHVALCVTGDGGGDGRSCPSSNPPPPTMEESIIVKRRRRMRSAPLPMALMRHVLTFLEVDGKLVAKLCRVSRAWRALLTTPGAIRSCRVYLGLRRTASDVLPWLRGVAKISAESHGDMRFYDFAYDDPFRHHLERVDHWRVLAASIARLPTLHTLTLHVTSLAGNTKFQQKIHGDVFRALTALQVLDLRFMQELRVYLHPLTSLHTLTLRDCGLVLPHSFATLTALEVLRLQNVSVPHSALERLPRLRVVDRGEYYGCSTRFDQWEDVATETIHGNLALSVCPSRLRRPFKKSTHIEQVRDLSLSCGYGTVEIPPLLTLFPHLEALTIEACDQITDGVLRHLTQLQSLTLSHSPITRTGLQSLVNLHTLSVDGDELLSVDLLTTRLTALKTLRITHRRCETPLLAHTTVSTLTHLEALEIHSSCVTDDTLKWLTRLRSLRISNCERVTDKGLAALTNLEDVDISDCKGVLGSALTALTALRHIRCADSSLVYNRTLEGLRALPNLRSISTCSNMNRKWFMGLQRTCKVIIDGPNPHTHYR